MSEILLRVSVILLAGAFAAFFIAIDARWPAALAGALLGWQSVQAIIYSARMRRSS